MSPDFYTKATLTVIAAALIGLIAQNVTPANWRLGGHCGSSPSNPCYITSWHALEVEIRR